MLEPMHTTVQAIYDAYVKHDRDGHRAHLGASLIGEPCERRLWYTFRWAGREKHDGRMLRLFEVGNKAEERFAHGLRLAGVTVETHDNDGNQFRVNDHGGHFGGSLDGVGLGLVEAPKSWHVLEFKTHGEKSFNKLVKEAVKKAKPLHWAQMQVYMGYTDIDRAMYLAENKNTSELYCERVKFEPEAFARLKAKALRVIESTEPPPRISNDPTCWDCKYCPFHSVCHGERLPEVNCRTCAHSTPVVDASNEGKWHCAHHNDHVPVDFQRTGCGTGHRYIPILLEKSARAVDFQGGAVTYEVNGTNETFANGDGTDGTLTSEELFVAGSLQLMPQAAEAKKQVGTARVVG